MMLACQHQDMRTTLTLDEDVAANLRERMRKNGKSLKTTVNELLRLALQLKKRGPPRQRFQVQARDLGRLRPGVSLDNIGDLLEQLEGPVAR
jgi:Arc/MetJ family transcription regulator